ncbi:MAG: ABC transporter substrate-binding protein [Xanthobacteraceae bacterium]
MKRRSFIILVGGVVAWPHRAAAQGIQKAWRIGHIFPAAPSVVGHFADAFEQGMVDRGYSPGRNLIVTRRFPEPSHVEDAVRELLPETDVLVTWTTMGGVAAKKLATTIPVVFLAVGAPVDIGLVQSLNHPGGNMTGVTFEAAIETYAKRLQILTQIVPNLERVAVLRTIGDPNVTFAMKSVLQAAPALKVSLQLVDIKSADELPNAFETMKSLNSQALLVISSAVTYGASKQIAELAYSHHLPSCSPFREEVAAGGLVSLGPDMGVMAEQGADLVNKIINGAKPSDLPVEQPSRYEMFVNNRTARAFELSLPESFLGRADQVIE